MPPSCPSPTRIAGRRIGRIRSHCRLPLGPGEHAPPAVSTSAKPSEDVAEDISAVATSVELPKLKPVVANPPPPTASANCARWCVTDRRSSSSLTNRPSSATAAWGPVAWRHANVVCAQKGGPDAAAAPPPSATGNAVPRCATPSVPPVTKSFVPAEKPAATAACGPMVGTTPARALVATKSASESSGKPVCTGLRYRKGSARRLAAAARPALTSVLPTAVFAPQTQNAGVSRLTFPVASTGVSSPEAPTRNDRRRGALGEKARAIAASTTSGVPTDGTHARRSTSRRRRAPPRDAMILRVRKSLADPRTRRSRPHAHPRALGK